MMTKRFFYYFTLLFLLSGCSLLPNKQTSEITSNTDNSLRTQQLINLDSWKITGKIAFIQEKQRNSASLLWQRKNAKEQYINLSTYLGINVLTLTSKDGVHNIEVDGENYQGNNLDQMITELSQLNLPTQALIFWLKGLPYSVNDKLTYNAVTNLPQTLNSYYNQVLWQISYDEYQAYQGILLANRITIKQADLTIKISINQWEI